MRGSAGCRWACSLMKLRTFSTVEMVTSPPCFSRPTNLPSLTERRPKVDSAIRVSRQKAAISRRSVSACMPFLT